MDNNTALIIFKISGSKLEEERCGNSKLSTFAV